jgi:20S proteasome alpha/beta subunit
MGELAMMDELVIEEMSIRAVQEKMDEAFRAAMHRAINAGKEQAATVVSKKPGTRKPKVVLG